MFFVTPSAVTVTLGLLVVVVLLDHDVFQPRRLVLAGRVKVKVSTSLPAIDPQKDVALPMLVAAAAVLFGSASLTPPPAHVAGLGAPPLLLDIGGFGSAPPLDEPSSVSPPSSVSL